MRKRGSSFALVPRGVRPSLGRRGFRPTAQREFCSPELLVSCSIGFGFFFHVYIIKTLTSDLVPIDMTL